MYSMCTIGLYICTVCMCIVLASAKLTTMEATASDLMNKLKVFPKPGALQSQPGGCIVKDFVMSNHFVVDRMSGFEPPATSHPLALDKTDLDFYIRKTVSFIYLRIWAQKYFENGKKL